MSASSDSTRRLQDSTSDQVGVTPEGHTNIINSVRFSPDGKQILTASLDKTAQIWDSATGRPTFKLEGHTRSVNSAQFSPNGKWVLTTSTDKTARLWDAATGQHVDTFVASIGLFHAEFTDNQHVAFHHGDLSWSLTAPNIQSDTTLPVNPPPASNYEYRVARVRGLSGMYRYSIGASEADVSPSLICLVPAGFGTGFKSVCYGNTWFLYRNIKGQAPVMLIIDFSSFVIL